MDRNHSDASRSARGEEAVARRLRKSLNDALERVAPPGAGDCPDPEQIAAYQQRALAPEEVAQCESHFAVCARCREILSLVAATDDAPLVAQTAVARAALPQAQPAEPARPRFSQWRWWRSYWLVPALAATGALALFLIVRAPWRSSERTPQSLIAQAPSLQQASPSAAASAPPPDQQSGSGSALPPSNAARNPAGAAANSPAAPQAPLEAENFARAARPDASAAATNSGAAKSEAPAAPPPAAEPAPRSADTLSAASAASQLSTATESAANAAPNPAENATGRAVQAERAPAAAPPAPAPAAAASARAVGGSGGGIGTGAFSALARNPFPVSLKSPSSAIAWRAGTGGLIQRSSDGGRTWQSQPSPLADDWLAGSAVSDTVCWLVGRNGAIARTVDGQRWEQIPGPAMAADSSGKQPDWVTVTATDAQTAVVGSASQTRFITRDAGNTWQQQP